MDLLQDLDGQTAPESTRGLFDPPPEVKGSGNNANGNNNNHGEKRHSAVDLSSTRVDEVAAEPPRAKSMAYYLSSSGRHHPTHPTKSALHTVSEEEPDSFGKPLQRKHRSSAVFNNFPMGQHQHQHQHQHHFHIPSGEDDDESYDRADALAEAEAKLIGAYGGARKQAPPQGRRSADFSRHDDYTAATAAAASPAGPGRRASSSRYTDMYRQEKQSRRLSEPSSRHYYQHEQQQQHQQQHHVPYQQQRPVFAQNKRTSLQWPATAARYDEDEEDPQRRPPALSLDTSNKRRNSRNYGNDWRASASSSGGVLRSPTVTTNNRNSYAFVPFTPTRISFAREDNGSQSGGPQQRRALFTAHLPFSALVPLLKAHQLVSGILRVNKRNRSDAYVYCEELNADIYICGSRDRNRALEGDIVAIKLVEVDKVMREKFEKEQAKVMRNNGQPIVRKPDEEDEKEIMFGGEEDVDKVKPKFCGVVVAILERAQSQMFSGTLGLMRPSNKRSKRDEYQEEEPERRRDSTPRIVWFKPTDKRVPLIAIPVEQAPPGFIEAPDLFENRLFLGSIKRWPITSLHPFGVLENELGHVDDQVIQLRAILADNNFPIGSFPEAMLRTVPLLPWTPSEESINMRLDLRSHRSMTIDSTGDGCLDNALSIHRYDDNIYEIGFHVADITAFAKPHSPLDKEAKARAAGVHMEEKATLWPDELLHGCTDLIAGADRFAFSVIWKLSQNGQIVDTWYGKTVIRSHGVLSLNDVQDILDHSGMPNHIDAKDNEKPEWGDDIQLLFSVAQNLRTSRMQQGAMFLREMPLDIKINNSTPTMIGRKQRLPSEDMIEEFKILANTGVAEKVTRQFPEQALLLSQGGPNERKLSELTHYLSSLGYHIDPSSPGSLQSSVDAIENEAAKTVITVLVLKAMERPKFFCTGKFDINRYHHYALNVPLYAEFTMPSRRFADFLVHRQLEAALSGESRFYLESDIIQKIARHCNVKSQAADYAREQTQHLFLSKYLNASRQTSTTHEAIVVGVQEQAFDVMVPELGLERRIHVINLPLETYKYNSVDGLLHLFWRPGVATADAMVEHTNAYDESEEDDLEEDLVDLSPTASPSVAATSRMNGQHMKVTDAVNRLSIKSVSPSSPAAESNSNSFSKRRPRSMSLRAIQGENPWTSQQECTIPQECRQIIRPFDYIRVVITSDPNRSPALIRVLAANPFV